MQKINFIIQFDTLLHNFKPNFCSSEHLKILKNVEDMAEFKTSDKCKICSIEGENYVSKSGNKIKQQSP